MSVTTLRPVAEEWRDKTNADIVAILKDYLASAEKGEFSGLAIVAVERNGELRHQTSTTDDYIRMTGALQIVLHRHLMNSPTDAAS